MSIATYDAASRVSPATPSAAAAPARRGFWGRVLDRMAEARMRQAEQYIAGHRYLIDEVGAQYGKDGRFGQAASPKR